METLNSDPITVANLILKLRELDPNLKIVIPGFQGRVKYLTKVKEGKVILHPDGRPRSEHWNYIGEDKEAAQNEQMCVLD